MQLEEIPFIWMAGCLGNCSRASNSFQQRKIIGWIPASDWADDQGSLPSRLSFTLVPLSQQRCARGGWVCLWVQATRNRPSGKGRSRNSVEPVVLTLSDSFRLSRRSAQMFWGEISNSTLKRKPKSTQTAALLQDRLWVPKNMHDKGNSTLTALISEQRIRPRLTLNSVCRLDWSWTHNPTDSAS